jgi:hypothetical protein
LKKKVDATDKGKKTQEKEKDIVVEKKVKKVQPKKVQGFTRTVEHKGDEAFWGTGEN